MSLRSLDNTKSNVILTGDSNIHSSVIVNADLTCNGTINGNHASGLYEDNVWTGTNTYNNIRPTTNADAVNNEDMVRKSQLESIRDELSVVNLANTWTDTQTFNNELVMSEYVEPVAGTDGVPALYLKNMVSDIGTTVLSSNNTWGGSVIFEESPYIQKEIVDLTDNTELINKLYADNEIKESALGNTLSTYGNTNLTMDESTVEQDVRALFFQVVGGGGGASAYNSNSCSNGLTSGVSGGSGACFTVIMLVNTSNAVNTFNVSFVSGTGGDASIECGVAPTVGGDSTLSVNANDAVRYYGEDVLIGTAGGGGVYSNTNILYCGSKKTSKGGVLTRSALIPSYFSEFNGLDGSQNAGSVYQYGSFSLYGTGGSAKKCTSSAGEDGGYTLIEYYTS